MIYVGGRQSGKTTMLVQESARTGAIIVVPTYQICCHVVIVAEKLGLKIPDPITTTHYIQILAHGGLERTQKYLVDELQTMLSQMGVETATMDEGSVSAFRPFYVPDGYSTRQLISDEIASLCSDKKENS